MRAGAPTDPTALGVESTGWRLWARPLDAGGSKTWRRIARPGPRRRRLWAEARQISVLNKHLRFLGVRSLGPWARPRGARPKSLC